MNYPCCSSKNYIKSSFVKKKQAYKCKLCYYRYTVVLKSTAKADSLNRPALAFYLEGLVFRSIGRLLKVSHISVYYWIKTFGESTAEIKSNQSIEVVVLDELHTYIGDKKMTVGSGLQ